MIFNLNRYSRRGEAIDGTLSVLGIRLCDTSENQASALPAGIYDVVRFKCHQYGRYVPLIVVNPNEKPPCRHCDKMELVGNSTLMPCHCPQFKCGNGIFRRTDGSIIVGTHIVTGCVGRSRESYELVRERLRKAIRRHEPVRLIIKEDY